jgi:tripartite-type tricarboxylate transporter receptor subunit TctC
MDGMLKGFAGRVLAAGLALAWAAGACAQEYPAKPVRLIVPVAAAGMTDIIARIIGRKLQERIGQPVLVENKAGAGGNIGTESVVRSTADGYTLLYAYPGPIVVNPWLQANLGYDPVRDLAPVSMLVSYPMVLAVHPSVPAATVAEFIAAAKQSAQPLTYGSAGNATTSHLIMELFSREAGISLVHVPYKGAAPAMTDLIAGRLSATVDSLALIWPQHKAGKIRAIAITSRERKEAAPDLPTVAESGIKDFEVTAWQGILAPAGTPPAVVERLSREFSGIVGDPEVRKEFAMRGLDPSYRDAKGFAEHIRVESATWRRVVAERNIKAN